MHDFDDADLNPSTNPSFDDVLAEALSRRKVLKIGGAAAAIGFMAALGTAGPAGAAPAPARTFPAAPLRRRTVRNGTSLIGFSSVPLPGTAVDDVLVADGYTAEVLFAWGDPIANGPAWSPDASQDAATQAEQAGMHHDGMAFFPRAGFSNIPTRPGATWVERGLLAINHEYIDPGLLFTDGTANWTPEKSAKALAAHGISVIEVMRTRVVGQPAGDWEIRKHSRYARRITGATPFHVVGPARGSQYLQTEADPRGVEVLGTLNNCGGAATPWGTYLAGEENYDFYFYPGPLSGGVPSAFTPTREENRYHQWPIGGLLKIHEGDSRFDMRVNRNETNRFGWIVEIDPFNRKSRPVKLTGLGRFKHEMAAVRLTSDGRAVAYSGDDERNNYVYKFVASRKVGWARKRGRSPLAEGTLYVAKFNAGDAPGDAMGTGEWIPLTPDNPALAGWTADRIAVFTRLAADAVGATRMDRPEWLSVAPDGQVYVTCTNNTRRGRSTSNPTEAEGQVPTAFTTPVDEANPRGGSAGNPYGHIIRWTENGDADALTFTWDVFALAGDPANPANLTTATPGGNINGDMYASPDAITIDRDGRVWIGTDMFSSELGTGAYANMKNNMLLAADPETKETRRFLVGPRGCEVTGITFTPDGRTMFVNIQHPGEPAAIISTPPNFTSGNWPDGGTSRPRSATLVVTKNDGGVIGT
jgi:secreted PhoX family phosphatase